MESIDVVRTKLRGAEARAFAIADNRTAELAEWDAAELKAQLDELEDAGFDLDAELAFNEAELAALLKEAGGETAAKGEAAAGGPGGGNAGGGGGAPPVDQYKVLIDCKGDEGRQTAILDAIDQCDGPRLAGLLQGLECRALVWGDAVRSRQESS